MTETTAAYEHLVGRAVRVRRYTQPGMADNHPGRVLTAEHVGTVTRLLPHDVIELLVTDSPRGQHLHQVGLGYVFLGNDPGRGRGEYLVTEVTPLAELAGDAPRPDPAADVEVGTTRSLRTAGRDMVRAAMDANTAGTVTHVTLDGRRIAAVVPAGQVRRLERTVELLNAYGEAMNGVAWLPGLASEELGTLLTTAAELAGAAGHARYIAHFTPEAWQRDQAVEVDPQGPQEWDCTAFAQAHLQYLADLEERAGDYDRGLPGDLGVTDNDDVFQSDPAAPAWVREWRGPFTIRIRSI